MRWKREKSEQGAKLRCLFFFFLSFLNFKYSSGFIGSYERVLPDLTRSREQTQTPEKSTVKKRKKSETEIDLVP